MRSQRDMPTRILQHPAKAVLSIKRGGLEGRRWVPAPCPWTRYAPPPRQYSGTRWCQREAPDPQPDVRDFRLPNALEQLARLLIRMEPFVRKLEEVRAALSNTLQAQCQPQVGASLLMHVHLHMHFHVRISPPAAATLRRAGQTGAGIDDDLRHF